MRKILDKMFGNKRLSFWVPIIIAAVIYLLFLFFGVAENKSELLLSVAFATVFWLFGSFFVLFVQVKNSRCSEWFMNFFELLVTVVFVGGTISYVISFIIGGFQDFELSICQGIVTYSSVSWAYNKRPPKA